MFPRTRGPRTKCPSSGQDVPLLFNTHSYCEVSTCGSVSGEMGLTELEYDHFYDYAAFGHYPTGSSKNQPALFSGSASSTFARRMECCTTLLLALPRRLAALTGTGRLWYERREKGEGPLNPVTPAPMVSAWLVIAS